MTAIDRDALIQAVQRACALPLGPERDAALQACITLSDYVDTTEDRASLLRFTQRTWPQGQVFNVNWHHELLYQYLDDFARGLIKNLMVFMPPRMGKSEGCSRRLPAYLLGRDPDVQIISCSYSAKLARRMNRDVQRIVEMPAYRALYPETRLAQSTRHGADAVRTGEIFEVVGRRGVYVSAGIGGGIVGMGADVGVIDDPIRNAREADSEMIRDHHWEWYTTVFLTRMERGGRKLIISTRWHEDDLAGRLLKLAREDPSADQWIVLRLPALALADDDPERHPEDPRSPGESIWPWKKTVADLAAIRATLGSYRFDAIYQQSPSSPEGTIFKRDWLGQFYHHLPATIDELIQSWDMKFKSFVTTSYVVGQVWARVGGAYYLVDQVRDQMGFSATCAAVEALSAKWPRALMKLVEAKANGPAVVDSLRLKVPGLIEVEPQGGKIARAQAVTPVFEAGNIWLPHKTIAPWIDAYIKEMAGFPNAANDDQVDATSQALMRLAIRGQSSVVAPVSVGWYAEGRWA